MDFSFSNLFAGLVFGTFGFSFFKLGRKRSNGTAILLGVALMVFPYLVENVYLMWGIGSVLLYLGWSAVK
jgi:hypothetical protein